MFLFLKLYLAHLIADFILQFKGLYQLKLRALRGHIYHVLILAALSLVLVLPYLKDPFIWIFIGAMSLIHFFQDVVKYLLQQKDPKKMVWYFTIDQVFHLIFLSSILVFPISKLMLDMPALGQINFFYASNRWTLRAILFILSSFGGAYFLHALRRSFFPNAREKHFITRFEIAHGVMERAWISFLWLCPVWIAILLTPAIGFLRLFSQKLRSRSDFLLSFFYATLLGIAFRFFLGG